MQYPSDPATFVQRSCATCAIGPACPFFGPASLSVYP